ncbi:LysR family transcriptional regulator [Micromonospora mangrovi]|uniref:LysR family transcriptional regulator n=2 Tax=Micromonospora TaxID=1873 RepID=A0AAU7MBC5_9ACTN
MPINGGSGIDSRRLRALQAVGQSGSLAAAARRMRMSISGLRYQLDELERSVGVPLVRTSPQSGATLTPAGVVLVDGSSAVLAELDELVDRARRAEGDKRRPLRVAAPWTVVAGLLLDAVASDLRVGGPGWQVDVAASRDDALMAVRDGAADVAVAADWARDRADSGGLVCRELFSATYLLAVGAGSDLAGGGSVDVRQTAGQAWIMGPSAGTRRFLDVQLESARVVPKRIVTSDSMEYMTMIDAGVGVGLAEPILTGLLRPRTVLVPLTGVTSYRYFAACPDGRQDDPQVRALLALLTRAGRRQVDLAGWKAHRAPEAIR